MRVRRVAAEWLLTLARGAPALADASAYESMAAVDGFTTPSQEFGNGRRPAFTEFLDERLAEGRRQVEEER
jgi:hypothetical protein